MQMGCGRPTWNGQLDAYCSKACRDTRVCVRPGCGRPTWNGNPNEFCTRACRQLGPPHEPREPSAPSTPTGPKSALVPIADDSILQEFQELLDSTRKGPPNNWTRDRGCKIHGVGDPACTMLCACSHKVPVPSAYEVVRVEMNTNPSLWTEYTRTRDDILQECQDGHGAAGSAAYAEVALATSACAGLAQAAGAEQLVGGCNEWRLFHGTTRQACEGICESNFSVDMAGSGATWKKPGQGRGMPLYGYGIYLAECITKADEYARPEGPAGDLHSVLVCRVAGGRAHAIQDDTIDVVRLQRDVTSGRCDSVIGDRVTKLGRPFREIVIYSGDQVLPEFVVTYKRL